MNFEDYMPQLQMGDLVEFETPPAHLSDEMKSIFQQQLETPETNFDILLNKYLNNHEITDVELQQLSEFERNALSQLQNKSRAKAKRPDECHKLFYKRAFKFSQNKYFKRTKNKSRKMSQFYHHHFDHLATPANIPITEFYHPNKKTRPGLASGFKTFNLSYIRRILKSKSFRADVREYHRIFLQECMKERLKKIESFKATLLKCVRNDQPNHQELVRYLQGSQCKIPWTSREIYEAWDMAQRELEENEDDDSDTGREREKDYQARREHEEDCQARLGCQREGKCWSERCEPQSML